MEALSRALDRMAEGLESALSRERELEASRRDLVTAVSHDLRTPLASLRAMVEAVDDGVVEDSRTVRRYVGEMRRSVEQIVTLVEDLFELVQVDAAAIERNSETARLEDVVRTALAVVEPHAEEKGVLLVADLGIDLRAPAAHQN